MFPTLCFVDETYDIITEENKEQFREILTEEEYESLFSSLEWEEETEENNYDTENQDAKENKVFYKMKSLIWFHKVIDYFSK